MSCLFKEVCSDLNSGKLELAYFLQDYHPLVLKFLLDENKIDVNNVDRHKRNFMHYLVKIASTLPDYKVTWYLDILLSYKCNLTSLDKYGYSPIHLACIFMSTQNKVLE